MMLVAVLGGISLLCALGSYALHRTLPHVRVTSNSVVFNRAALRQYNVRELQRMTRGFSSLGAKQRPVSRRDNGSDSEATVVLLPRENCVKALLARGFENVPN